MNVNDRLHTILAQITEVDADITTLLYILNMILEKYESNPEQEIYHSLRMIYKWLRNTSDLVSTATDDLDLLLIEMQKRNRKNDYL